ncbi:MAG TPA: carboxypeptidase-like regulatory domain-containing protein [Terriglobales bacterium]|nr:carboxypeptidase-like regulatory domain-containing protein [Terriglobales bacterium]
MSANRTLWVLLCVVALAVCPVAYGQATGSFFGTVTDTTGSVIAGAKLTVTAQETGISRDATTDQTGHYLIPLLAVGNYTVRVSMQNFQTVSQTNLRLQVDEHRELDFTLPPGTVAQTVEVSATPVAVQTSDPTLGQVITSQQVAQLPLNGRDFVQLATLTPGTTQETNPQSFFNGGPSSEVSARGTYSLSVGGSRAQSTDWLLDGNDNNELTAGGIAILPSIDAIQEFKVLTFNYSAEYGTRAGPTVLVTTKSGTNNFHGSVFEFFRNTKLDARSFFAAEKEKFNLNQFGGALGGPIQKDKTFFFVDYQGKRQRHGIPFVGTIPTPAMKNGDFRNDPFIAGGLLKNPYATGSDPANFQCVPGTENLAVPVSEPINSHGGQSVGTACNVIPAALFDPVGKKMMDLYPNASNTFSPLGTNFSNVPVRSLGENEFDVRVDHSFSPKDSIFARFSYDQATSFVPGGSPGFAEQGAFASTQNITNHGRNVAVSETHVLSDRTVNQFSAGFNRIFNHILSFGDKTCESANLGIQGANLDSTCPGAPPGLSQSAKDCMSCGLTSTLVGTYWSLGDRGFAPFQGGTNVFDISDSFDMIRGKHDIKVGGQIRAQQMNVETNAFQDGFFIDAGTFTGDGAADLLLGQVLGTVHDQTFLGAVTGRRWKMFRPYVEDDWRATKDLTVNLGVAWALVTPITESRGRQANFDFATGKLLVAGPLSGLSCSLCVQSDGSVGIQFDKTAFEPRIGLAWKPRGSQNTAIRAGYAIFHDSSWNQGAQGLWENPPYLAESDNFISFAIGACPFGNTTVDCGLSRSFLPVITSPPNPDTFPGTLQSQNLNFRQGMVQQFNANFERQLPGNAVVTVGYAGSRSTHILVDGLNLNVHSPTACGSVPGYTLGCGLSTTTSPYPGFGTISNNNDVGRAKYDSLQLKLETKSSRHGLYALLGYTYSRTYDSGMPDGLGTPPGATYWPLPGSQKLDWGLSQINLNHQFTASVLYNLPFGKGKHFGGNWNGATNAVLGGWEVDVIEKATSGFPLFIADSNNSFPGSGVNFQWNGDSLIRPDLVGDPNKPGPMGGNTNCPSQVHTLTAWFNPCAFALPAPGELGNAPRSFDTGPRFVNTDLSLIKHFALRENMQLDFRSEFFNLFNHPQFFLTGGGGAGGMQDIAETSTFAVVNQTVNNPRVIQFALKLQF